MKYGFKFLIIFVMIFACIKKDERIAEQRKWQSAQYTSQVDSVFGIHWALLDSIAFGKRFNDFSFEDKRIFEALTFMEEITGIPSGVNLSYIGVTKISKESIHKWKKWFDENKSHLMWDERTKTIVRIKK